MKNRYIMTLPIAIIGMLLLPGCATQTITESKINDADVIEITLNDQSIKWCLARLRSAARCINIGVLRHKISGIYIFFIEKYFKLK